MRRISVVAMAVVAFATVVTTTTAGESAAVPAASQPPPQASIANVRFVHPKRAVHRHAKFTPTSTPSVAYVRDVILPYEARRYGVSLSHLRARVACESGYRWWASNGQYHGIGQFASSTYWRGVSTLGSRKVVHVTRHTRKRPVIRIRTYTDGTITREERWRVTQTVIVRRVGKLRPGVAFDAWTEARIMAQAIAGRSAVHDSEWECRG